MKNRNIYIIALLVLLVFVGCKHSKMKKENNEIKAFINKEEKDVWGGRDIIDTNHCKALDLIVLNNPYNFKDNKIIIYFGSGLVYKGYFNRKMRVYIPDSLFNKRLLTGMGIQKDTIVYDFLTKTGFYLNQDAKYLYLVFCPENDKFDSWYLFAQKDSIR